MDDWYFARWATGSKDSIWKDLESCYLEVYKSSSPPDRLQTAVEKILVLFDSLGFKSTFFITGYIASHFKDLVRKVSKHGHEIACHNYFHIDYRNESREKFRNDLLKSKQMLEDICGKKVIGYRSPNSSIPIFLVEDLIEQGFRYDSSVTPSFFMRYKSGDTGKAPRKPYKTSKLGITEEGNAELFEFPWAIFPALKLPAGSGILHRVVGNRYNDISIESSLKQGHTSYYFHPYEIMSLTELSEKKLPLKARIFLRDIGSSYLKNLKCFLEKYRDKLINGEDLLNLVQATSVI